MENLFTSTELTHPDFPIFGVERVLTESFRQRASDIHIIPLGGYTVTLRVDGVFRNLANLSREHGQSLLARMKVLGRMKTFVSTMPQEGRISLETGESTIEARISTFPTVCGEKGVIRIFEGSGTASSLEELSLSERTMAWMHSMALENQGVVAICGPSGSGKTTTLYALLSHIHGLRSQFCSIATLEDPVERITGKFAQTQVSGDLTFHKGLMGLLRQDPEIIMIGEIRDPDTASVAFEAGLTGHLILTTLHCDDPHGAILRLRGLEVTQGALVNALKGVLCMRLLRKLCTCSIAGRASEMEGFVEIWKARNWPFPVSHRVKGAGCEICGGTGYFGRVPVSAALESIDPDGIQGGVLNESISFGQETRDLLESGIIDFREVIRIFPTVNRGGRENPL
ncbi:MAG: hypothetical protein CVV64_10835 [Candidatus Wallbacteria bacterium HGW-Wallbacteria-1]|jgi:type II secretory ATPase GspE/PulE/Tfp pilus assembly ATPase PilB-like protein|uniref:AAA+ ATPase domain-containing protein n=1 Tax=Candidatus Wallbacteria bacterium HGW-Wallbacteria-1 TaxID=2013854 RepID=A0A2N1PPF1_9BACT|nr:MAG: hypothetical protein CVV64_10835 [Candidatus Wallbacteria bacterium HGW-Wallbacteria-1]